MDGGNVLNHSKVRDLLKPSKNKFELDLCHGDLCKYMGRNVLIHTTSSVVSESLNTKISE